MRVKTEAIKGVKEYSPKKSIAIGANLTSEVKEGWDKSYRKVLLERVKVYKAKEALSFSSFSSTALFNEDLDNPAWFWNDSFLSNMDTWQIRDLAILLERKTKK